VCKLQRALYSPKESPRAWYARLSGKLRELGFLSNKAHTSLFIFDHDGVTIYMLVYVNDIVHAGSYATAIERLVQTLAHKFPIKDLGHRDYFLGIDATYTPAGMIVMQHKYALNLLHRAHMEGCRLVVLSLL
jgi:hypothetical protein